MGSRKGCFDWLPAGWKMEIRSRSTGKTDRFYIDPVSGYAFRSMNEVFRYLDTGKVGRRVFKHKDKDLMKQKSKTRRLLSTAKTGKPKTRQNSKAQKLHLKNQNTESDVEDPEMQTVDLQKLATLLPCGSKERCTEFIFPLVGELVVNLRIENPVEITDNTPEQMKIIPNQYEGEEESTDEQEGVHDNSENDADKEDDDDIDDVLTLSDEYILEEEEDANPGVNENTGQEHQEIPLASASASASSCEGLWNDPCIEFAIKTLTGELPIDKDTTVTTYPGAVMGFHNEESPFECQDLPKDSVKTSSVNVNKEQVGGNVVMQHKCLTKGGVGGGLNWPTFADYRVTKFSWTNSDIFPQKF